MTRRLKSASGEYVGWKQQPNQPRECYVCGKPVHLNQNVGFRSAEPPLSWHFECAKGSPRGTA